MRLCEARRGAGTHLLWDADRLAEADARLFDPQWWRDRRALTGEAEGRGAAYFVDGLDGCPWVLRHNRRGGLLAQLNHDRFLWLGVASARTFRELRLLAELHAEGLPVPEPVAARAIRHGALYRGDIITRRIEDARPLAERLHAGALPAAAWRGLGTVLARFHRAGVWHPDPNARNILIDGAGDFYLIDFDKARRRAPGRWHKANLARLYRSLDKFRRADSDCCFADSDWADLCGGYASVFADAS